VITYELTLREMVRRASTLIPEHVVKGHQNSTRNTVWAILLVGLSSFVYSVQTLNAKLLGDKHVSKPYMHDLCSWLKKSQADQNEKT